MDCRRDGLRREGLRRDGLRRDVLSRQCPSRQRPSRRQSFPTQSVVELARTHSNNGWRSLMRSIALVGSVIAALGMASGSAFAGDIKVSLTGAEEVPAVTSAATGSGTITVKDDGSVSGSVTTKGIAGVAAHIHQAAAGKNGPPVIPLEKKGDNEWVVPAGAKLNEAQLAALKAGELYVNVHSAEHKGGEIRAQLKP